MENLVDAHYFVLPTQGNIYCMSKLGLSNGLNKLLVASLGRKVYSFEYSESEGYLSATIKEILFTYIPGGCEIIAIDAFNKSKTSDDFLIGIAIIKPNSDHVPETYLNIYSEQELDQHRELNLESVAQNCLTLDLNFVPYQLYHTELPDHGETPFTNEVVWLLSGSDLKIHMFQEDKQKHIYSEGDTAVSFPELAGLPSIVYWLQVHYIKDYTRRLTVFGCEDGYLKLSLVDCLERCVVSSWSEQFKGPITKVLLFNFHMHYELPRDCFQSSLFNNAEQSKIKEEELHLVVTNSLQASAVFMDVLKNGLSERRLLPGSDKHDVTLCSYAADIDMDGEAEILLGTYAENLLMYKYSSESGQWSHSRSLSLANPIHSLMYEDITGDGVKDLLILTLRGVHVLQHNPNEVLPKFIARLKQLVSIEVEDSVNSLAECTNDDSSAVKVLDEIK